MRRVGHRAGGASGFCTWLEGCIVLTCCALPPPPPGGLHCLLLVHHDARPEETQFQQALRHYINDLGGVGPERGRNRFVGGRERQA